MPYIVPVKISSTYYNCNISMYADPPSYMPAIMLPPDNTSYSYTIRYGSSGILTFTIGPDPDYSSAWKISSIVMKVNNVSYSLNPSSNRIYKSSFTASRLMPISLVVSTSSEHRIALWHGFNTNREFNIVESYGNERMFIIDFQSSPTPMLNSAFSNGSTGAYFDNAVRDYILSLSGNAINYNAANGTISGPSTASHEDTVTLTVTPDTGYALSSIAIYKTASQDAIPYTKVNDTTYTFVMPDADVTVTGVFARVYAISIATSPTSGGAVSGLPSTALPNTTVTFRVLVNENFTLASYEFTGADVTFDRDTMEGSFVMPERLVYGTIYFSSTNDPNDEGGTSTPGGGTDGTYDDVSNAIPIPPDPSTGILYDVTGQGVGKGLITVYNPTLSELQDLGQWLYSTSWGDALYQGIRDLFAKPIDALISLHILPFVPSLSANKHAITLGPHNTQITSYTVSEQYKDVSCGTLRISPYWDSYLDYSPYTRISLFLPYIGSVELNPDIVMGKLVGIRYRCDVVTGGCVAYLFTYETVDGATVESIFGEYSGSMALSLPMTGSDFSQLISGFVSAVSSVAVMKGFAGSAMMNNAKAAQRAASAELSAAGTAKQEAYRIPAVINDKKNKGRFASNTQARNAAIQAAEERYSAAQDALNMARGQEKAVKSLANATRIAALPYTVGQVMGSKVSTTISGTITGGLGLLGSQKPYVIITRPRQSLADNYKDYVGYPCNMECVLSSLSGFTQVEQVKLTNIPCTEEELAMLYEGLKDGVYI